MGSQLDFVDVLAETNLLKTPVMSKSRVFPIRCDFWKVLLKAESSPASVGLPLPDRRAPDCLHLWFHLLPFSSCLHYQGEGKETHRREGRGGQTCKVSAIIPQLQLQCLSSAWHWRPFALLFLLLFMPIQSFGPPVEQTPLRGQAISMWNWPPEESTTQASYPKPYGWCLPGKMEKKLPKC